MPGEFAVTTTTLEKQSDETSLIEFILSFDQNQLGVLAFNLGAMSYIGVNMTFFGALPTYVPGSYVHPNFLTIACGAVLICSLLLAAIAIRRGNIFPSMLVWLLAWNVLAGLFTWCQTFPLGS
jgi:hypothetical protein